MASESFKIQDNVLQKYNGKDAEEVIPEGVTHLEDYAFRNNLHIQRVFIPASLEGASSRAFQGCKNLREFVIHPDNKYFAVQDGTLLYRIGEETGEFAQWMVFCAPSAAGDYTVPEDKRITQIWRWAFADESGLVSVTVPGTVKVLRSYAFHGCRDLERVVLCEGVEHLDYSVFTRTKKLKEVILPSTLTEILDEDFKESGIATITFPPTLNAIRKEAFASSGLKSVVLPATIQTLEKEAFRGSGALREVTVSCNIPANCFAGCPVERLTIHGSVEIAPSAFNSTVLKEVIADDLSLQALPKGPVRDGAILTAARRLLAGETLPRQEEYLKYIKAQRKRLYPLAVKEDVLLQLMFREQMIPQKELELVTAEAQKHPAAKAIIKKYGSQAAEPKPKQSAASKAPKSDGPKGPTVAEMKQIWGFKKLPDGTLRLTAYKGQTASEGRASSTIIVPAVIGKAPVTELEETFGRYRGVYYAWDTETILLPDGLRVIGKSAFAGCDLLKELVIPDSVVQIGESAFSYRSHLTALHIPPSVRSIGDHAFQYSGLTEITLPDTVEALGIWLFRHCEKLTSVTLPKTLKELTDSMFEGCTALETVELPASLEKIGSYSFAESGITSLVIPDGVREIGYAAFFRCEKLKSLTIPASVEVIADGAFGVNGLDPDKHLDVTIQAPAGSFAERYAKAHGFRLEVM